MSEPMKSKEIVLPTGAYCNVRTLTGRDWLAGRVIAELNKADIIFTLATLCTKIDDKPLSYDQLLDMDLRDVMVLTKLINEYLNGPVK